MHAHTRRQALGPEDHTLGGESAPVTLIEYGDFQCPRCRQAAGAARLLLARFGRRVRLVFRHFPLEEEIHPYAWQAAEAAECAAAQGRFWEMHDVLFENQLRLDLGRLYGYARTLRLDMTRFSAGMGRGLYRQRIAKDYLAGNRAGVRATPTFVMNDRIQDVSYGMHSLFDAIEGELQR